VAAAPDGLKSSMAVTGQATQTRGRKYLFGSGGLRTPTSIPPQASVGAVCRKIFSCTCCWVRNKYSSPSLADSAVSGLRGTLGRRSRGLEPLIP
jgi:hypothetical protein